jgi:hypothetical protein
MRPLAASIIQRCHDCSHPIDHIKFSRDHQPLAGEPHRLANLSQFCRLEGTVALRRAQDKAEGSGLCLLTSCRTSSQNADQTLLGPAEQPKKDSRPLCLAAFSISASMIFKA